MFAELQTELLERLAKLIPNVQPQAVVAEEVTQKAAAQAAQQSPNQPKANANDKVTPIKNTVPYGRNDLITITNGSEEKTIKYKKAESLLGSGWSIKS